MTKGQLRFEVDHLLKEYLLSCRLDEDIKDIIKATGVSEKDIARIEEAPGKMPSDRLMKLIEYYDTKRSDNSTLVFFEINRIGYLFRHKKEPLKT